MVENAIVRLEGLVEQEQHLPTSLNAVKEVLDPGLGTVRGNAHEGDNRPLIQIGIGLTMTPTDMSQLTVVEARPKKPPADVIDAPADDAVES